MGRATFGIVIGALSLVIYILAGCFLLFALTQLGQHKNDEMYETQNVQVQATVIGITLLICICMAILSVLLIMGIKQERHKLMAPWVFLSIAGVILSIFKLLFSFSQNANVLIDIIKIALQIAMTYPIFTLYRDIQRKSRTGLTPQQPNAVVVPANVTYTSAPYPTLPPQNAPYPNTNYNQVPQQKV